jgi:hypothetical protein
LWTFGGNDMNTGTPLLLQHGNLDHAAARVAYNHSGKAYGGLLVPPLSPKTARQRLTD